MVIFIKVILMYSAPDRVVFCTIFLVKLALITSAHLLIFHCYHPSEILGNALSVSRHFGITPLVGDIIPVYMQEGCQVVF